jgi:eukaryotic-like serine/threonine-protein kinase
VGFLGNWLGGGQRSQPAQPLPRYGADRPCSPGDVLCGDYVVRLRLGQGGMGEVYLVEHASSGELRAAKVMRARSSASVADLIGFRQEALALLNVGAHPFFVRLLEVHEQARDTVLVMEYVAPLSGCTTVQDYITRTQDYTDRLLGMWAVQFCVGMEHALSCGVTAHRDIKPGNLLVDSGVFMKIADFGLALAADRHRGIVGDTPKGLLQLQQLQSADGHRTCGTPGYIAPELFAGAHASAQSDMFSFGVTLWQLAARSMVSPYGVSFRGDPAEYQRVILTKALTHAVRHINSPYFEVIHRCLAPDPARRYPDFAALREAIKSASKAANLGAMDFIVASGFRGSLRDYVNRGRAYLVLGRHERALRILNQAVRHNPDCAAALVARAEALSHRGQVVAAMRDYESAHRREPEADAPLTGLASTWLELGRPAPALTAIEKVLARHPANVDALLLKTRVLSEQGRDHTALDAIEKFLATEADNGRAHEYRGRVLWSLGRLDDAADAFGQCLQVDPLALDARLALASLLTGRRELAAAEAQYEHAQLIFRRDAEVLNKIAAHMAEHGHAKKAIALFHSLAELNPDSRSTMLVNIGNAHLRLGDRASAVSSFTRAINVDADNALAHSRLGDLEDEDGRYDRAAAYFAKACELESENWSHHACAGTAYLRNQNFARARSHLQRSVELFPEQPLTLYNLAAVLVSEGDAEAAVEELAKAVGIDKEYARGWYLKAQIEARLGRAADAAASARCAMANGSSLSTDEVQGLHAFMKQYRFA